MSALREAPRAQAIHEAAPVGAERFVANESIEHALRAIAVAGALLFALGLVVSPDRAWRAYLTGAVYLAGLGLGGAFFVAIQHVTRSGWSVAVRRVPEAMAATLPVAALAFVPVILGAPTLYEWTHDHGDPVLEAKAAWLSLPFFALRSAIYFGIWIGLTSAILRRSRAQDQDGSVEHTRASVRLSGFFIALGAPTVALAAFDWTMSLEPRWFSTIYGVYHWSGLFLSGLAAMALLVIVLRREGGPLASAVTDAHLLDLGRLILGFSTFFAYIWFSQYMLIWYSNLPEETAYFAGRTSPLWRTVFLANLAVNWVVPFLVLLPRPNKRSDVVLGRVCVLLLLGRWLDLYLDISQPVLRDGPALGLFEVGPVALALAVFGLSFLRAFARASAVPQRDPYLVESLNRHA